MPKILLVEDDQSLAITVEAYLLSKRHVVDAVAVGTEGLERALYYKYDLVILDWSLPTLSGIEICRQYRAHGGAAPILMLTGKSQTKEKEVGLDAGADDYLTKPFEMAELGARVQALLRRAHVPAPSILQIGKLSLDLAKGRVKNGETVIHLLPKEFALLEFFMRNPNQPFDAATLVERIWHSESGMSPDAIRTYITRLRAKIDCGDGRSLIETVRGQGYIMSVKTDDTVT